MNAQKLPVTEDDRSRTMGDVEDSMLLNGFRVAKNRQKEMHSIFEEKKEDIVLMLGSLGLGDRCHFHICPLTEGFSSVATVTFVLYDQREGKMIVIHASHLDEHASVEIIIRDGQLYENKEKTKLVSKSLSILGYGFEEMFPQFSYTIAYNNVLKHLIPENLLPEFLEEQRKMERERQKKEEAKFASLTLDKQKSLLDEKKKEEEQLMEKQERERKLRLKANDNIDKKIGGRMLRSAVTHFKKNGYFESGDLKNVKDMTGWDFPTIRRKLETIGSDSEMLSTNMDETAWNDLETEVDTYDK